MSQIPQETDVPEMPPTVTQSASEITSDAIANRAYEIYLSRGGADGQDIDDWLQAEHELRAENVSA